MATMVKVCQVCGTDVSHQKRTKDAQGRYYCEPCYRTVARRGAAAAPAPIPQPPKKPAAIPLDDDDGPIELADDLKKAREPEKPQAMFGCADCKKIVPEKQIRNDDGDFVCLACFAKRREKTPVAVPKKKSSVETPEADENPETWKDTLAGGAVISAGVVVLTFGIFLLLQLYMKPRGKHAIPPGGLLATVLAFSYTVFVVVGAGALMVSMVLAARLLGGIDFGYIGSALWKALVVALGFTLLIYFGSRSETLGMLGYALNGIALLVAFVVVFRIDFFEAMILSAVNFLLFLGLAFVLTTVSASLSRSFHGDLNDDSTPIQQNEMPPRGGGLGL
jgi:hypothetical protein